MSWTHYTKRLTLPFSFIPFSIKQYLKMQIPGSEGRHCLHNRRVICLRCNYYVLMSKWHKDCLFGKVQMLFVCFHFLPLLHKRPAISPRQAEQLSIAVSQQDVAKSQRSWQRKTTLRLSSQQTRAGRSEFSIAEGVATLIFSPHQSIPLCPPSSCELNSCTGLLISQEYGVLKVDYRCF